MRWLGLDAVSLVSQEAPQSRFFFSFPIQHGRRPLGNIFHCRVVLISDNLVSREETQLCRRSESHWVFLNVTKLTLSQRRKQPSCFILKVTLNDHLEVHLILIGLGQITFICHKYRALKCN